MNSRATPTIFNIKGNEKSISSKLEFYKLKFVYTFKLYSLKSGV